MSPSHLHILQHSLGLDQYGQSSHRPNSDDFHGCYRNRYYTSADSPAGKECQELVALGLMEDHGPQPHCSGMNCYTVTDEGYAAMKAASPPPPKVSRSAKRWAAYLVVREAWGMSFKDYLKWPDRREHEARAA